MIKKRWSIALATFAAAGLLLSACAPVDDSGGGEDASSSGPVTLTYWDFLDPSQDNPRSNALRDNIANVRVTHLETPYAMLGMLQPRACGEQILNFAADHDGIVCRE